MPLMVVYSKYLKGLPLIGNMTIALILGLSFLFCGAAFGKIESGNLERSNVDITSEMITMLKAQQAFSGVSRLLQTEVDITKRLIDG